MSAGDDRVAVDETNGVFTDTERTTLDGEPGGDCSAEEQQDDLGEKFRRRQR
jgi:hypothetical protein